MMQYPNLKNLGRCDSSLRIHDHERNERKHEDDRENNGDAIEVLLNDARTGLGRIDGAGDHIANARALTRVQHDERNQTDTGDAQQNHKQNTNRVQDVLFLATWAPLPK